MREILAFFSILIIILLFCLCIYLPENKTHNIKIITVVNNEVLLNKSYKSISCEEPPCNLYYANFSNQSVLINQETYNRIKEGEKIKLTTIDKNPNFLSWLIIISIFFFVFIIIACVCAQPRYEGGGEYYG